MKDNQQRLQQGPAVGDGQGEQLPSGLVATMWLCVLTSMEREQISDLGECNMALAFDLGIAVQVAEEEQAPLPDLMVEVFEFYNRKLELSMPSKVLAKKVAERYYSANELSQQVH